MRCFISLQPSILHPSLPSCSLCRYSWRSLPAYSWHRGEWPCHPVPPVVVAATPFRQFFCDGEPEHLHPDDGHLCSTVHYALLVCGFLGHPDQLKRMPGLVDESSKSTLCSARVEELTKGWQRIISFSHKSSSINTSTSPEQSLIKASKLTAPGRISRYFHKRSGDPKLSLLESSKAGNCLRLTCLPC